MPLFFNNPIVLLYFLLSFCFISLSFISIRTKNKTLDNINFFLIFFMALCFYGLRYPGTVDTKMYLEHFDALSSFINFEWGIGFYWLMVSIKKLSTTHSGYVLISSFYLLFCFSILIIYVCKDKYYKSLFLISLFLSGSILDLATNTYRQGIALPFVTLFAYSLIKKNYIVSICCALIALGLHWNSALILVLIAFGLTVFKSIKFLKITSVAILLIFSLSFIFNLNIAVNISKLPILQSVQSAFFGVNLLSKVDSYLGAGVDGADFYQMNLLQRFRNTGEIFVSLIINVVFLLTRKPKELEQLRELNYIKLYSLLTVLSIYGVLLISMTWFFRNFYWVTPIVFMNYLIILRFYEINNYSKFKKYLLTYVIFQILFSTLSLWRLPFLEMSYPVFY